MLRFSLEQQPSPSLEHEAARNRYRAWYADHHLAAILPPERFERLLANEGVLEQILRVAKVAKQILPKAVERFQQHNSDPAEASSAYIDLSRAVTDYYFLVSPCPDPNQHPGVLAAEKRWGIQQLSRQAKGPVSVWLPGAPVLAEGQEYYRGKQLVPADSLNDKEVKDSWNWFGPEGLIVHVAGAAELYRTLTAAAQLTIGDHPLSRIQRELIGTNPYDGAVSLWLHDHGRVISHDPLEHIVIGQLISLEAGLPEYYRSDFNLPTEIGLQNEEPRIDPTDIHSMVEEFGSFALLWTLSDDFSKFIPPENWKKGSNPHTLRVRTPGTEERFLRQRLQFYADPDRKRFYDREIKMIGAMIDWLLTKEDIQIPQKRLDLAFMLVDKFMHEFMKENYLSYWLSEFPEET